MATEDILINDGDSFVSLSALAAEQVDAKLPIESDDGTVTLDSPSANTFTVATGGTEVGRFGATYFRCSSATGNYFYTEQVGNYQAIWIGGKAGSGSSGNVGIQTAKVTGTDTDGRSMTIVAGASTGAGLPGELNFATSNVGSSGSTENQVTTRLKIDNANRILVNTPQAPDATPPNVLYVNGSAISSSGVQTPSVSGLADNDASIVFDANCSFLSSGIFNFQFKNADNSFGSKINVGYNETSSTGFANIGVGGCYWYLRDSKRFGIGATGINFNANAAANASTYDWQMEPDGTFVANANRGIEAAYITAGRNNSGGTLSTSPKIFLDGEGITAVNTDGSDYTPTQPNSIATKQIVDDKIWVGTTAEYNALTKNPTTLYCLTD